MMWISRVSKIVSLNQCRSVVFPSIRQQQQQQRLSSRLLINDLLCKSPNQGFPANFLDNSAAIHQLRYLSLASDKEIVKTHKSECKSSETLQSRAGAGEKQGLLNKIAPIKIIMRGPAAVKETYLKIKGKYDAKMSDDDFRTKAHFIFLFFGPISPAMPMYAFCYMLTLPTSHPLAVW